MIFEIIIVVILYVFIAHRTYSDFAPLLRFLYSSFSFIFSSNLTTTTTIIVDPCLFVNKVIMQRRKIATRDNPVPFCITGDLIQFQDVSIFIHNNIDLFLKLLKTVQIILDIRVTATLRRQLCLLSQFPLNG